MNIASPRLKVDMRWLIRRDHPEVIVIEKDLFEFPWTEELLIRCLRQRNCIGLIAEHDERIVGYTIYELHKTRIHILNFAVGRIWSRMGIGRQMAEKLISKISPTRMHHILAEVRETNREGQEFFSAVGFRAVTVLRDFYDNLPHEDAYVFRYDYKEKP